ncbi:MAG: hypothetical protein ACKO45_08305 [Cyanobium sp.]
MQLLEEPRWLTLDRCIALERLKNAHLLLATVAACDSWPGITSGIGATQIEQAHRTIERNRWAMRQRSWARQGRPRPGPEARAAMAKGGNKGGRGVQARPPAAESLPGDRV